MRAFQLVGWQKPPELREVPVRRTMHDGKVQGRAVITPHP